MERSFKERLRIWKHGGRGYWRRGDWSRIQWDSGEAYERKRAQKSWWKAD
jgi:hypothetical protein